LPLENEICPPLVDTTAIRKEGGIDLAAIACDALATRVASDAANFLILDFVDQFAELVDRDVGQMLAALVEAFVDLDDCLAHEEVGLFGSAGEQKVVAASDSFVAVRGVEGQAQQAGNLAFLRESIRRHGGMIYSDD
jgi:hypothetical protein